MNTFFILTQRNKIFNSKIKRRLFLLSTDFTCHRSLTYYSVCLKKLFSISWLHPKHIRLKLVKLILNLRLIIWSFFLLFPIELSPLERTLRLIINNHFNLWIFFNDFTALIPRISRRLIIFGKTINSRVVVSPYTKIFKFDFEFLSRVFLCFLLHSWHIRKIKRFLWMRFDCLLSIYNIFW